MEETDLALHGRVTALTVLVSALAASHHDKETLLECIEQLAEGQRSRLLHSRVPDAVADVFDRHIAVAIAAITAGMRDSTG
jgi:hypothetical protein